MALRLIRKDPIALLELAARAGDVVALPMPRFPVVLINRPELVWDVLATSNHGFMKGPTMQVAKRLWVRACSRARGKFMLGSGASSSLSSITNGSTRTRT